MIQEDNKTMSDENQLKNEPVKDSKDEMFKSIIAELATGDRAEITEIKIRPVEKKIQIRFGKDRGRALLLEQNGSWSYTI